MLEWDLFRKGEVFKGFLNLQVLNKGLSKINHLWLGSPKIIVLIKCVLG